MSLTDHTILITDRYLNVLGDPIVNSWTSIDVTLKFNEPGSGLIVCPAYPWILEQVLTPGCRIVVIRNATPSVGYTPQLLIAGPVEQGDHERSDDGDNSGVGKLTINFADDLSWIAARCAYPNPALLPAAQDVDAWTFTGGAEPAMRALVNLNAGPGALLARQVPELVLGSAAGVGSSITAKADRMEPLADVLRRVAIDGGGLGFRVAQVGNQIQFQVYQPADRSGDIRFGFNFGNMKYSKYSWSSPKATAAIVGGQGTGADRAVIERSDDDAAAAWGRSETLVSRAGSGVLASLQADGDKALSDGAATALLATNVVDTPDQRYGVDYNLGDLVSLETAPGQGISDVVRTVHVQAWSTAGEIVSATVGSQGSSSEPAWVRKMRAMDAELARLARNVTPAS